MFFAKLITLLTVALLAGGWSATSLVMTPAQQRLSADTYTVTAQANMASGQQYFPILSIASIVLLVLLLLWGRKREEVRSSFIAASLALLIGAAGVTAATILPLNAEIRTWSAQSPPAAWQETRDAWRNRHRVRTTLAVAALLLLGAGLLSPLDRRLDRSSPGA